MPPMMLSFAESSPTLNSLNPPPCLFFEWYERNLRHIVSPFIRTEDKGRRQGGLTRDAADAGTDTDQPLAKA
jgi:hypothetical protein